MLSGQTTSLDSFFGGESYGTAENNASPYLSEFASSIGQSSSEFAEINPTMQNLYKAGSVFNGAGTILEPLIIMAGPGIVTTLFDLVGTQILNFVITPIISQMTTSDLNNFLDTMTRAFGCIDNMISQASVLNQKSSNVIISGNIDTHNYGTQQYNVQQSYSQGSSSCGSADLGCQLSDVTGSMLSFANLTATSFLNIASNPFDSIWESILSGIIKIYGAGNIIA